jgi:hypothetical protein
VTLASRSLTTVAALAAAAVVVSVLLLPPDVFEAPPAPWRPATTEVRGVYHIHTRHSDGTGTAEDVAEAAARAGLRFVIITDHGDATRQPDPPTYRSGVLCIDAVEISTTGGHYAALGLGRSPYRLGGEPRDVVEDVRRLGGFGIAAHPLSSKPELAWRGWDLPFDAMEWLNEDSLWRNAPGRSLTRAAWTYLFRPVGSIAGLYGQRAELRRWDALQRHRRVLSLAGADAHARLGLFEGQEPYVNPLYLEVPSYEIAFRVASIRALLSTPLTGKADADATLIVNAIRAGHVHSVIDGLGHGAVFEFTGKSGEAAAGEGDVLPLSGAAVIRVRANPPPGGSIVLFRDGVQVHRVGTGDLTYATDRPGTYRAEVQVAAGQDNTLPWIVSNPIVLGSVPAQAPEPKVDTSGPRVGIPADGPAWAIEHDPTSHVALDHEGGIGLSYSLGKSPSSFTALAVPTTVPAGATGVSFVARAGAPMRLSVQVRAASGSGWLRWRRSVYIEPSVREVVVPFGEMTPTERGSAKSPDLGHVTTLLLVVDSVNAVPGSSGRFVVNDVRFISPGSSAVVR